MIYLQKKKKKKNPLGRSIPFTLREKTKSRTWDAPSQTHKPYTN